MDDVIEYKNFFSLLLSCHCCCCCVVVDAVLSPVLTAMKRMYAPSNEGPHADHPKRPRKANGLKVFDLPPHHFHIGNNKFVVVSDFRDCVKIHIREYRLENELYYPTKMGITVSPSAFQTFSDCLNFFDFIKSGGIDKDCVKVFRQEFLISKRKVDFENHYMLQRMYSTEEGLCKILQAPVISLSSSEFEQLHDNRKKVMDSVIELLFGSAIAKTVLKEKELVNVSVSDTCSNEESEMFLVTVLSDTILSAIKCNINKLHVCEGCEHGMENQLAHSCATMPSEFFAERYFDQAVADLNVGDIAKEFVRSAAYYLNYADEKFFKSISISGLLKTIREQYEKENEGYF